jgi:hypothetical protein
MTLVNSTIVGNLFNPEAGPTGPAGIPGPPGSAATIEIGTVSTGEPGSDATVVNVGTSSAAVLDFSIPSGLTGETGEQGEQGIQGEQGVRGSLWTTGSGAPSAPANVGDCYLDTVTGDVWQML